MSELGEGRQVWKDSGREYVGRWVKRIRRSGMGQDDSERRGLRQQPKKVRNRRGVHTVLGALQTLASSPSRACTATRPWEGLGTGTLGGEDRKTGREGVK